MHSTYSSNERGEKGLLENEKKLGGDGGRNRVKFHFENIGKFWNLKKNLKPSLQIIFVPCLVLKCAHYNNLAFECKKMKIWKKF